MAATIILIASLIWYSIGLVGYWYWEGLYNDILTSDIPEFLAVGFLGPVAFALGYKMYGKEKVLFKKRAQAES